ncbi:manganese efflux pump MntP [Pseudodesulfovibrio sediminis]|uniref:Putative manganese efflux pump MntP n=1 Tax=Pseudodesulfovibrio sediminis TaxID=2810563 RepID=A0ABM9SEG4_9BACT|nr:manganese efflux pump MntP family protein [Pseudodesulfovibrio sediminis]BCS87835.1 putative manganese efflux pump MntP [Pseudodesulfovibrio sediminis]
MGPTELIVIAIALAMDAFAVSIASGVTLKCVSRRQTFRLAWHFGLFQALMPILGWYMGSTVSQYIEAYDHWIAFVLLGYIGGNMIRESFQEEEAEVCDPTRGKTLIILSIATSIDALAVGLSLAMLGISVWWPAFIIGVVAALFTVVGLQLGKTAAKAERIGKFSELAGGIVLIAIGIKILWEHGALPF